MIFLNKKKKNGFLGILGPPYCGIGAPVRISREMLCTPYAGFFCYLARHSGLLSIVQKHFVYILQLAVHTI